jgi:site-specific DNA-methyltransferase (adenine-specific)/modification methylase
MTGDARRDADINRFRNQVIVGECVEVLSRVPERSVDLIFADPPYNLQLRNELYRPNLTRVDAVDDAWDKFSDLAAYDAFTESWLSACRRVLGDNGAIWVIGSYHNIFRVGRIMMDLGFWILNDVHWIKTNPMPNFRGMRFTNATETLIWAKKSAAQKRYTFNHHAIKALNDDKQMRSDWHLPLCTGAERLRQDGQKAHSTQKPEALLYRVLLASSNPGDLVLDPFLGSGTTAVVARRLRRDWLGIEISSDYAAIATERLAAAPPRLLDARLLSTPSKRTAPRVAFGQLVEAGLVEIGERLFSKNRRHTALVKADAHLQAGEASGSIHRIGARVQNAPACNGWEFWHVERDGALLPIDALREKFLRDSLRPAPAADCQA